MPVAAVVESSTMVAVLGLLLLHPAIASDCMQRDAALACTGKIPIL